MKAEKQVKKTIEEHSLINKGDVLVLGLSGGPDSLCLLHILRDLEGEYGFSLRAFHLNHMIREDAEADEEFLKDHCKELGVPLECRRIDVPRLSREKGESLEEAGRKLRQSALREICERIEKGLSDGQAARPVLAHNADDQAETVLLRIIRGTGVHGLGAMEYMREDGLIRPLLDTSRKDIEEYCKEKGLGFRTDSTNSSEEYLRNRVRLSVLPMLEEINPSIKKGLVRLAANAYMDDSCLSSIASDWYISHVKEEQIQDGAACPVLLIKDLRGLEDALFYRAVRAAFAEAGLTEDIEAVHIKALLKAVYANTGNKSIEFPGLYEAYLNHGKVYFRKKGRK